MRRSLVPCVAPLLLALLLGPFGCDDDGKREKDKAAADQVRRAQEDAQRAQGHAIEVERRRDQDRRVLQAQKEEAREDTSAAIALWIASSAALVIVTLLLARENRIRRVLQQFIRRILKQREDPP